MTRDDKTGLYWIQTEGLNNYLNEITGENVPVCNLRDITPLFEDDLWVNLPNEEALFEFVNDYDGSHGKVNVTLDRTDNQDYASFALEALKPGKDIDSLTLLNTNLYSLDLREADGLTSLVLEHNHNLRTVEGLDRKFPAELFSAKIGDNAFRYDIEKFLDSNPSLTTPISMFITAPRVKIDLMSIAENPGFMDRYGNDEDLQKNIQVYEAASSSTWAEYTPEEVIMLDAVMEDKYAEIISDDFTTFEKAVAITNEVCQVERAGVDENGEAIHDGLAEYEINNMHTMGFLLEDPDNQQAVCSGMAHMAKWLNEKAGIPTWLVQAHFSDQGLDNKDDTMYVPKKGEGFEHMIVKTQIPGIGVSYTDLMNMSEYKGYAGMMMSLEDITDPSLFGNECRMQIEPSIAPYPFVSSVTVDRDLINDTLSRVLEAQDQSMNDPVLMSIIKDLKDRAKTEKNGPKGKNEIDI